MPPAESPNASVNSRLTINPIAIASVCVSIRRPPCNVLLSAPAVALLEVLNHVHPRTRNIPHPHHHRRPSGTMMQDVHQLIGMHVFGPCHAALVHAARQRATSKHVGGRSDQHIVIGRLPTQDRRRPTERCGPRDQHGSSAGRYVARLVENDPPACSSYCPSIPGSLAAKPLTKMICRSESSTS